MNDRNATEDGKKYAERVVSAGPLELIFAFADAIAHGPGGSYYYVTPPDSDKEPGKGVVLLTFRNEYGPTVEVDDIIEKMTMADWRDVCDKFCAVALKDNGYDPEYFDWPTPIPTVTFTPEDEGSDIIASVKVRFEVDAETFDALRERSEAQEETCCECDATIRYVPAKGKNVVTCPKCGTIQPLCSDCHRPEREKNECNKCKLYVMCNGMNRHMAKTFD